jgi:hypothetical protein
MDAWLIKEFAFLGIHLPNWMLADLAIILIGITIAWWDQRVRN